MIKSESRTLASALCLLIIALVGLLYPTGAVGTNNDGPRAVHHLLETGSAERLLPAHPAPTEIKVVSYNMRYRAGSDLDELIELLKTDMEVGGAALIGLQECDRNRKRTGNVNTARVMAERLGMHYVWAAPPNARPKDEKKNKAEKEQEEETGVAILSPYPMRDVERIILTHEGPNRRRRAAIGATVRIGERDVRVYSVHAETRMPVEKKIEHWRAVLEDLARHSQIKHTIVLGDFNTIKGKEVRAARRLFTEHGFTTPFDDDETFKVFFLDFKLDWVWLRGVTNIEHGIDKKIGLSDHWPLWLKVKLAE